MFIISSYLKYKSYNYDLYFNWILIKKELKSLNPIDFINKNWNRYDYYLNTVNNEQFLNIWINFINNKYDVTNNIQDELIKNFPNYIYYCANISFKWKRCIKLY